MWNFEPSTSNSAGIPSSRRSALALRSAFTRAPPSFWRLRREDRSDYEPMLSLFRRFRQRPGELIARSPPNSHSKTTAAARGTVRWNEYAGEDIWKAERHHGCNDRPLRGDGGGSRDNIQMFWSSLRPYD